MANRAEMTDTSSKPGNPRIPSSSVVDAEDTNLSATFIKTGVVVDVSFLEYEKLITL